MTHDPTLNWMLHNVVFFTDAKLLESALKVAEWGEEACLFLKVCICTFCLMFWFEF